MGVRIQHTGFEGIQTFSLQQQQKTLKDFNQKSDTIKLYFSKASLTVTLSFSGGSIQKKKKIPPANAGDTRLIPGSGRPPGEGNGNPLQYSCLGNPMDRGATVYGVAKRVRHELVSLNINNKTSCYVKMRLCEAGMQREQLRGYCNNPKELMAKPNRQLDL